MLTLNLEGTGDADDVARAASLEFNLGVRVKLNGQYITQHLGAAAVSVEELHPVFERDILATQIEVTETSP
jgi:hypothetical protein